MAFLSNISGAAAGAAASLDEILTRKLLEKQQADALAAQQQQQGNTQADNARADAQLQLQRDQFANTQARQGQQDEIAATDRRQGQNQQGVRRMIGDFLVQRGSQPLDAGARQTMQGMALQEDVDLPETIAADPNARFNEQKPILDLQHRHRMAEIGAQWAQTRQTAAASGQSAPDAGMRALAVLTARSGQLPEGTATQRGDVMQLMASDPALMQQYEQTRMAPIRAQAETMLSAVNDLLTEDGQLTPGARAVFGEWTPVATRGMGIKPETVAANASLRQVIGQRVVDLILEMKNQSQTGATGFGQLNRAELDIILSAATRLTQRLPEAEAQRELVTLREKFSKILQPSPGELAQGGNGQPMNVGGGGGGAQSDPLGIR